MKNIIIFIFLCISFGAIGKIEVNKLYKRDMIIKVNNEIFEGVGVVPLSLKYVFHVEARGNLDMFIMTSCHKEEQKERAWNVTTTIKSGLFGWGKKKIDKKREVNFSFYPNIIEKDGDCPLELGGYEKEKGRHSWAFIDFESEKYKLKAKVLCNGRSLDTNGVSVCQSRNGLFQKIIFDENVIVSKDNNCGIIGGARKEYEIILKKGKCVAVFVSLKKPRKYHKITLIGYESILIRN